MFGSTLSQRAQNALALLGKSGVVKDAYLAGGSALALHFGHRESEDLDFFSKVAFDPRGLDLKLQKLGKFKSTFAKGISLIGVFEGVKFSYFQYNYPLLKKPINFLNISIASPEDIAAMKLAAIVDRGTKKDYIDIYELVQKGISLEKMFSLYDQKYRVLEGNWFSLLKALGYLDDAEASQMPHMFTKLTWDEVKAFFARESLRLGKKYLEG